MITKELLEKLCPTAGLNPRKYNLVAKRDELVSALNTFLPQYGIDTKKRVDAALSCWGIETDYFRTTEEYASGADYEGRKDLGNTQKGDGKRFKGRGVTQTTGRYNYSQLNKTIGPKLGIDFLETPERLDEIPVSVESACIFWQSHNLNQYADAKEIKQLNGVVNRGDPNKVPLGWAKRNELYSKCFRYVPEDVFADIQQPETPAEPIDDNKLEFASATLQRPSLKTVAKKAGWRIGSGIGAIWGTTSGKIAVILTGLVVIGGIGYTAYLYRKQVQLGWQIAVATIKKKVGLS